MSMITRAAVAHAYNEPLIVDEVELRDPRASEVLVAMKASGLCHTDLSIMKGSFPFPLPAILGHEGAGTVVACGSGVSRVQPGDNVVIHHVAACGHCAACQGGRPVACAVNATRDTTAFTWRGKPLLTLSGIASFAAHTVVREEQLTVISAAVPLDSAAIIPCGVLTGSGAVRNAARVTRGSTVAVVGMGSIGLNVVQAARQSQASRVVAIDLNPAKEEVARLFGATDFLRAETEGPSLAQQVQAVVGGPLDYAFECVGNTELLAQTMEMINPFWGVCMAVGVPPQDRTIALPAATFWLGRTLRGTHIGDGNPREDTLRIVDEYQRSEYRLDELISHRLPLEHINEGFELMKSGQSIRTVVIY